MKTTSDRWHTVSTPLIAVLMLYLAVDAFGRDTTHDLAWGSLLVWNSLVILVSYVWLRVGRRSVGATIRNLSPGSRTRLIASMLGSMVVFVAASMVGTRLLEQDGLGLQILGGILLAIAAGMVPAWTLRDYRLAGRTPDPGTD